MTSSDQSAPSRRNDAHLERLTELYRMMTRIRAFETAAETASRDKLVPGPIHLSIGQEGVAAGVCLNLGRDDYITTNHRGHGHTLAKGADSEAMMRELFGRQGGTCDGKGGSMHIADFSVGMLGANGVVGAGILIAVGAAHAVKIRGGSSVVVCFFGDGATNRGPFLEGLNWAKVYGLPVLFVCEDNQYAATTRTAELSAGPGPSARAESLGIPSTSVDGNDVVAVDRTCADLVARVRAGAGPLFLHARTFRLKGHTSADADQYRDAAEVAARTAEDPLLRTRAALIDLGLGDTDIDVIDAAASAEMAGAFAAAKDAPWPAQDLNFADVQDTGFGQWR